MLTILVIQVFIYGVSRVCACNSNGCSAPDFTIPQSQSFEANLADNKVYIKELDIPTFTGDSSCGSPRIRQVSGLIVPGSFPEGDNVLTYRIDVNGQTLVESFNVHVNVIRCPNIPSVENGRPECKNCLDYTDTMVNGAQFVYICFLGHYFSPNLNNRFTCNRGQWYETPNQVRCFPVSCGEPPTVHYGSWICPNNYTYAAKCFLTCQPGFRIRSISIITCQSDGRWSHRDLTTSYCQDVTPPEFDNRTVLDRTDYAGPNSSPVTVQWTDPVALDSGSTSPPRLRYLSDANVQFNQSLSGQTWAAFPAGTHIVVVVAEDEERNMALTKFTVTIKVVTCQHPRMELNATADLIFWPNPAGPVPHGATLSIICQPTQGMTQQGAKSITCLMDSNTHVANWTWGPGNELGMKPNCFVVNCPPLRPPINGALTCFDSPSGIDCLVFCNDQYDVPVDRKDSINRFTCPRRRPMWFPPYAPDCIEIHQPLTTRVQADIFYYTGDCENNTDYLKQTFIERVNSSETDRDLCDGVPACRIENIRVECGPTSRHRRSTSGEVVVKISFDLVIGQRSVVNNVSAVADRLTTVLRRQTTGNGSLVLPGLTTDARSVGRPVVTCNCPPGMACSSTHTCLGCAKGYYMENGTENCVACPINTYQNQSAALSCIPCPAGTSTASNASTSIEQCKSPQAGGWGMWSTWSNCSATCGGGQQDRQRLCDSPAPEPGGRECEGGGAESTNCSINCAVDGGWGNWAAWSPCSASCGGGETTRTRQCDSPAPQHGGLQCVGPDREVQTCAVNLCPVHGGWGQWTDWTRCSASCEGGVQSRSRVCDSPPPSPAGGRDCAEPGNETRNCNNHTCPHCPLTFDRPENALEPAVSVEGEVRNCSIRCQEGHVWAMGYQPYFYCGPPTNFTWSISPNASVTYEPPFCQAWTPIAGGMATFVIPVSHPCVQDASVISSIIRQFDSKMDMLPCKNVPGVQGECNTDISVRCDVIDAQDVTDTWQTSSNNRLAVVLKISGEIVSEDSVFTEGSPEYSRYMTILSAIHESIKMLTDRQNDLFNITINGLVVTTALENVTAHGQYYCPAGTSYRGDSCVNCTAGMYEREGACLFCPAGQFQNEAGSTECKPCPDHLTTDYEGAFTLDDCRTLSPATNLSETTSADVKVMAKRDADSMSSTHMYLAVGVPVGLMVLTVCFAFYLLFKPKGKLNKYVVNPQIKLIELVICWGNKEI